MRTATVLQLSDTHLRAVPGERVYGIDPDARLAAVLDAWAETGETADFLLLTGDLTHDGSLAGCERLAAVVDRFRCPMLAVPGNHDDPEAVRCTWRGPRVGTVGGWNLVCVDSTVAGQSHGSVHAPDVLARLDELDPRPTLVALHHPPVSRSTGDMFRLDGAEALLGGLAARPQVKAVVAGHLHDAVQLEAGTGLPILGGPSTFCAIAHDGDRMEPRPDAPIGARLIHLEDDGTFTSVVIEAQAD